MVLSANHWRTSSVFGLRISKMAVSINTHRDRGKVASIRSQIIEQILLICFSKGYQALLSVCFQINVNDGKSFGQNYCHSRPVYACFVTQFLQDTRNRISIWQKACGCIWIRSRFILVPERLIPLTSTLFCKYLDTG